MTLYQSCSCKLGQLMEGTAADAQRPDVVRQCSQYMLEHEDSAANPNQLHERRPDDRGTHQNGYRERALCSIKSPD